MKLQRDIAGCASLLGSIYVIFKNFDEVLRYIGCRPYRLQKTWVIPDMKPIDIATNYACICVYILASDCVWRIRRDVKPSKVFEFSDEKNIEKMSVTESGRIAIVWNKTKISVYDDAGETLQYIEIQQTNEVQLIKQVIKVKGGSFIGCNDRHLLKFCEDGEITKLVNNMGGNYILQGANKDAIVVNTQEHIVQMVDCDTFELKTTVLTVERDGVECPHHAHFARDTGQLLVSWLNYLDVYSFNENELHSYIAAGVQETRDQQVAERAVLEMEVSQNKQYQELVHVADKLTRSQLSATSGKCTCSVLRYAGKDKKLSCRRGTARCVVSVKILPIAMQQCRNYLNDNS